MWLADSGRLIPDSEFFPVERQRSVNARFLYPGQELCRELSVKALVTRLIGDHYTGGTRCPQRVGKTRGFAA
jgi:hypothetical protein